jgi:MoaA/NifB/PqqE/SkfB family radical SAM enzyme
MGMTLAESLMDVGSKLRLPLGAIGSVLRYGRLPLLLSWVVTNRCNLRCVYCGCPGIKTPEISTDEALSLVDQMVELGVLAVHLTGGEPLVRKDLDQIASRLRSAGVRYGISTNGTLVPKRMDIFEGCSTVSLSLDGPPAVHNKHRAEGQVDEVLEACRLLRELPTTIRLVCLVTSETTEECLDFVIEQARAIGAQAFFQPALDVVLATDDPNPVVGQQHHVGAIFQALEARKTKDLPIGNSIEALRHMATWPHQEPIQCLLQRVAVRIDPQGNLLPCHERAGAPDGESVLDGGLAGALGRLKAKKCIECWGSSRVNVREAIKHNPTELLQLAGSLLATSGDDSVTA